MPFLLRIILQRTLVFVYSILAFLGLAPETSIPTEQEARVAIEDRQKNIQEFFQDTNKENNLGDFIKQAEEDLKGDSDIEVIPVTKTEFEVPESLSPETFEDNIKKVADIATNPFVPQTAPQKGEVKPSDVVMNIVCSQQKENVISVSTGSGVIISPKGVVLTNTHVGQFVLLEDHFGENFMNCSLYRENIPTFGYKADILYISPDWIEENSELINTKNPKGTGENDYALLYITENTNPTFNLPTLFSYVNVSTDPDDIKIGEHITVAGYPGAPESILDIAQAGTLKTDTVKIEDVFTFNTKSVDILTTERTEVGARGASGGGAFYNNQLIGLIVTTDGSSGNARINALTTNYINKDLIEDTGKSIYSYINSNLKEESEEFKKVYGGYLANILKKEF